MTDDSRPDPTDVECETCGAPFRLDTTRYLIAVHDCDSGDWYLMSRTPPE